MNQLPPLTRYGMNLRTTLKQVLDVQREANLLTSLATAQGLQDRLNTPESFTDLQGQPVQDADTIIPELDGMTISQYRAALNVMTALNTFMTTATDDTAPISTALELISL